jgi:hypothetical protein
LMGGPAAVLGFSPPDMAAQEPAKMEPRTAMESYRRAKRNTVSRCVAVLVLPGHARMQKGMRRGRAGRLGKRVCHLRRGSRPSCRRSGSRRPF